MSHTVCQNYGETIGRFTVFRHNLVQFVTSDYRNFIDSSLFPKKTVSNIRHPHSLLFDDIKDLVKI